MASKMFLPEEDLTCPVCRDIFSDPVILLCSHSFCKACLQEYWKNKVPRDCPDCRKTTVTEVEPSCNLALKNLCEAFIENRDQRSSAGSEVLCSIHNEKLKLFCQEDEEPICLVCQISRKHLSHTFIPVEEAAEDRKKKIRIEVNSLDDKLGIWKNVKFICDRTVRYNKMLTVNTEREIKEEFKKLHQFLEEEEKARIAALRKEEQTKHVKIKKKIKELKKKIAPLADTIEAMLEDLSADNILFLLKNPKVTEQKTQVTLSDPQPLSGALIDVAKHLGNLTFRVWEKMKEMVKHIHLPHATIKAPVILDPNTASPWLSLSNDLTRVRHQDKWHSLPDNPERFTYYIEVLGSEGFCSGKHSWEVEVGDHPLWDIGVVEESVHRKKGQCYRPEGGIWVPVQNKWVLGQDTGVFDVAGGGTLILQRRPERIRVQLDYDKGELSFFDPKDMTHIYTYKHKFTERMFPYFLIGESEDSKTSDLQICQSELSLTVMSSE